MTFLLDAVIVLALLGLLALAVSRFGARDEKRVEEEIKRSAWKHFARLRSEGKI